MVPVGGDGGARHVSAGGVQQGVYAAVGGEYVAQVLLQACAVGHVGGQEEGFAAGCLDVCREGVSHFGFAAQDDYFGALLCEVQGDGPSQYARSPVMTTTRCLMSNRFFIRCFVY